MYIPLKKKKCKSCKGDDEYIFKRGMCKSCYISWLTTTPEGNEYIKKNSISALKKVKSEQTKIDREKKKEILSNAQINKLLEKEINLIVRLIDKDKGCISCSHGNTSDFTMQAHAGHYHSVGSSQSIRFNLFNIYKECSQCNLYLSGNEKGYRAGLIHRYGEEAFEYIYNLKAVYPELKLSREEKFEAINKARDIVKRLKKGEVLTRKYCNEYIGIYTKSNLDF